MLITACGFILFFIIKKVLTLILCKVGSNRFTNFVRKKVMYRAIIVRYILECSIDLGLSSLIGITMMSR